MTAEQNSPEQQGSPEVESLEQIRSILFGAESQQIQTRFGELNDEIAEALGGLRALIKERTDSIASKLDSEVKRLRDQLSSMEQRHNKKNAELDDKLQFSANELRQHMGALSETMSATERTLRTESERNLNDTKNELASQLDSLRDDVERDFSLVNKATVSRRTFSDALRELSERFSEDE